MKTLLVVDDNQDILEAVRLLMRKSVDEVVTSSTPDSIPMLLRKHKPQVVLLDMNFRAVVNTGNEGLFWLQEIRRLSPPDLCGAVHGIRRCEIGCGGDETRGGGFRGQAI